MNKPHIYFDRIARRWNVAINIFSKYKNAFLPIHDYNFMNDFNEALKFCKRLNGDLI